MAYFMSILTKGGYYWHFGEGSRALKIRQYIDGLCAAQPPFTPTDFKYFSQHSGKRQSDVNCFRWEPNSSLYGNTKYLCCRFNPEFSRKATIEQTEKWLPWAPLKTIPGVTHYFWKICIGEGNKSIEPQQHLGLGPCPSW